MFVCLNQCEIVYMRWEEVNEKDRLVNYVSKLILIYGNKILHAGQINGSVKSIPVNN